VIPAGNQESCFLIGANGASGGFRQRASLNDSFSGDTDFRFPPPSLRNSSYARHAVALSSHTDPLAEEMKAHQNCRSGDLICCSRIAPDSEC